MAFVLAMEQWIGSLSHLICSGGSLEFGCLLCSSLETLEKAYVCIPSGILCGMLQEYRHRDGLKGNQICELPKKELPQHSWQ